MADPIFNEQAIIELLAVPVNVEYANALQAGTVQAIIDLFDRDVTRDELLTALEPALHLYAYVEKMKTLRSIKTVFDEGTLSADKFDVATSQVSERVRQLCMQVTEIMKRLQQCPTSMDIIH